MHSKRIKANFSTEKRALSTTEPTVVDDLEQEVIAVVDNDDAHQQEIAKFKALVSESEQRILKLEAEILELKGKSDDEQRESYLKGLEEGKALIKQDNINEQNAEAQKNQEILQSLVVIEEKLSSQQSLDKDKLFTVVNTVLLKVFGEHSSSYAQVVEHAINDLKLDSATVLVGKQLFEVLCQTWSEVFVNSKIELLNDEMLSGLDCLIKTDFQTWDVSIDKQLQILNNVILNRS